MTVKEEALKKIMERCCVLFGKKMDELDENTRFIDDLGAKSGNVSQMTNFSNLIEQYCSALDNIIANYETTEATNANTVAQRKY